MMMIDSMARRYLPEIVDLLENWGRFFRSMGGSVWHCRSIEHRYRRAPTGAEKECPHYRTEPDMHNAVLIEKMLCYPGFPWKERTLIIQEFMWHGESRKTCRALGLRYGNDGEQYEIEIYRACLMLKNRLAKKMGGAYNVNYKLFSPSEPVGCVSTLAGVETRRKQVITR